jgi:hypothetical protein
VERDDMPGNEKVVDQINVADDSIRKEEFTIVTDDDYARVDNLCRSILLGFYDHLLAEGLPPEEATVLANGADYFVRDFLVDCKGYNLFDERPGIVRQFAGNWYIINTIEPDIKQLGRHLQGARAFYGYLCGRKLISTGYLQDVEKECGLLSYYEERIETFWKIEGDGFVAWEMECPLKEPLAATGRA